MASEIEFATNLIVKGPAPLVVVVTLNAVLDIAAYPSGRGGKVASENRSKESVPSRKILTNLIDVGPSELLAAAELSACSAFALVGGGVLTKLNQAGFQKNVS